MSCYTLHNMFNGLIIRKCNADFIFDLQPCDRMESGCTTPDQSGEKVMTNSHQTGLVWGKYYGHQTGLVIRWWLIVTRPVWCGGSILVSPDWTPKRLPLPLLNVGMDWRHAHQWHACAPCPHDNPAWEYVTQAGWFYSSLTTILQEYMHFKLQYME